MGPDDLDLFLGRIADGDRHALADLYRATVPQLLAAARRLVRRRDIAEEVVQEAFVRVWRHASMYDPARGGPIAWLVTITRNCALDRLRARQMMMEVELADHDLPDPGTGGADAEFHDDRAAALRRCLEGLANDQRRAILLTYYLGLTHEELAARLDVPLGTAKSWVRRGVLKLKDCMEA